MILVINLFQTVMSMNPPEQLSLITCLFPRGNEMDGSVTYKRDEPQTDFIYCCGAITELLKFGSCQSGCRVLFLVIPGESEHAGTVLT